MQWIKDCTAVVQVLYLTVANPWHGNIFSKNTAKVHLISVVFSCVPSDRYGRRFRPLFLCPFVLRVTLAEYIGAGHMQFNEVIFK